MKQLYRFSAIALSLLTLSFASCNDYLDRDDDDNITEADVFARYEKVNGLVSDVYAKAKKADRPLVFFEHFSNSAITDECEGTNVEGNITNNFNNGAWNPNSLPGSCGQYWESLYEGIRKANLIIENVAKYNTPDNLNRTVTCVTVSEKCISCAVISICCCCVCTEKLRILIM